MNKHKNFLLTLAGFCATVMLAVGSADAQSTPAVKVNVPFEFSVDGKSLPPGNYTINRASDANPRGLVIRSGGGRTTHAFSTQRVESETPQRVRIVFHRYGDRTFLSQIWASGTSNGHQVNKCKLELTMEQNASHHGDAPQLRRVVITQ